MSSAKRQQLGPKEAGQAGGVRSEGRGRRYAKRGERQEVCEARGEAGGMRSDTPRAYVTVTSFLLPLFSAV